jgi:transcriptional regulator with XRE-family HTH domain
MKFPPNNEAIQYHNLRLSTGMTATEIAAALGVTRETISRREAGTARITKEAWLAMAYVAEDVHQVIWSYRAWMRGEGQHDEAQLDEAQHDETQHDETQQENAITGSD